MITEPPSPSKLELIRTFLRLNGTQAEIDTGTFLDRLGMPGSPLSVHLADANTRITYGEWLTVPSAALRAAYQKHRQVWQEEYERHVNWEFTEQELEEIVAFLEGATGQHFLKARWRMKAYVGTNTVELVEEIVAEARALLSSKDHS